MHPMCCIAKPKWVKHQQGEQHKQCQHCILKQNWCQNQRDWFDSLCNFPSFGSCPSFCVNSLRELHGCEMSGHEELAYRYATNEAEHSSSLGWWSDTPRTLSLWWGCFVHWACKFVGWVHCHGNGKRVFYNIWHSVLYGRRRQFGLEFEFQLLLHLLDHLLANHQLPIDFLWQEQLCREKVVGRLNLRWDLRCWWV